MQPAATEKGSVVKQSARPRAAAKAFLLLGVVLALEGTTTWLNLVVASLTGEKASSASLSSPATTPSM
jgi:hypothetical protein